MTDRRQPAGDEWRNNLEARLRGLPPPAVPADLEAKLLARIPARSRIARHRTPLLFRTVLGLVGSGLIAAGMLVAALVFEQGHPSSQADDPHGQSVQVSSSRPSAATASGPLTLSSLRWAAHQTDELSDPAGAPFDWPIETRATAPFGPAVTAELFD